eukprot:304588-Pyramimonas_sp.AAC.3
MSSPSPPREVISQKTNNVFSSLPPHRPLCDEVRISDSSCGRIPRGCPRCPQYVASCRYSDSTVAEVGPGMEGARGHPGRFQCHPVPERRVLRETLTVHQSGPVIG